MFYLCRRARVHDLESSNLELAPSCLHRAPSTSRRAQSEVSTCPNHLPHSKPCQAWRGRMQDKQHPQDIFCMPLNPPPYRWIAWERFLWRPLPFSFLLCALRTTPRRIASSAFRKLSLLLMVQTQTQPSSSLRWMDCVWPIKRFWISSVWMIEDISPYTKLISLYWRVFFWSRHGNAKQSHQYRVERLNSRASSP